MGIIIAAAAVFAIHIDKNHEIKINPNISLLGDDPIVLRVPSAILLKNKINIQTWTVPDGNREPRSRERSHGIRA